MIGVRIRARTNVGMTRKKSVTRISAGVGEPADEPGDDPDEDADEDRHERRQEPDRERDPGTVDGEVEHVPADLVRPQEVDERRRLEPAAGRGHGRLERPDEQRRQRRRGP